MDLVPLACEDEDKLAQGHIRVPPVSLDTHNPSTPKSNTLSTEPMCFSNICVSGPEVIKLFSSSTQLSMKFIMLINVKIANNFNIYELDKYNS